VNFVDTIRYLFAIEQMSLPFEDLCLALIAPSIAPAEMRRIAERLLKCLRTQAASRKRRLISLSYSLS
jgi:hypothetical protein